MAIFNRMTMAEKVERGEIVASILSIADDNAEVISLLFRIVEEHNLGSQHMDAIAHQLIEKRITGTVIYELWNRTCKGDSSKLLTLILRGDL